MASRSTRSIRMASRLGDVGRGQARTSAEFERLDTTNIDVVIFDLDQTLVDRNATFINFLREQRIRYAEQLGEVNSDEYIRFVLTLDNNGYADKVTIYQRVAQEFGLAAEMGNALYEDYLAQYGLQPVLFPHVHDLLTRLSKRFRLGMITNGRTLGQTRKIELTQIDGYFETIVISETEGIKKPDVRIFERCLKRMDVMADRAIYIGDNPVNDIDAPRSMGMKTIWLDHGIYDPPAAVDATVHNIIAVEEILS